MTDMDAGLEAGTCRFEPCETFRNRLAGDLFTCAKCGWWSSEHADDTERLI